MDLAHESGHTWTHFTDPFKVSILVLMDLAHELDSAKRNFKKGKVSILVLMDLAHEY